MWPNCQASKLRYQITQTAQIITEQRWFKAALMLFEEDDKRFHELFKQRCQAEKFPSEFYQPILLHARINDEGSHEQITETLLAEIPYVSPEEQMAVKKSMGILMESMVLRTHELIDYYGNPNNIIPPCFPIYPTGSSLPIYPTGSSHCG